jgi:hypothetical protein
MDVNPSGAQDPASGDDELAKVLAGVSDDPTVQAPPTPSTSGLQFEETPAPQTKNDNSATLTNTTTPTNAETSTPSPVVAEPSSPVATTETPDLPDLSAVTTAAGGTPITSAPTPIGGLDDIKKSALEELRPLVDKLNLSPEEKFDTILLIIRSTDDRSLVEAAYDSAKAITDETKRAQALLDVIKEIDYFANKQV